MHLRPLGHLSAAEAGSVAAKSQEIPRRSVRRGAETRPRQKVASAPLHVVRSNVIVRRLFGDDDIVDVALSKTLPRHPNEAPVLTKLVDGA